MRASNKPQDPADPGFLAVAGEPAALLLDLWHGRVGRTVRCVPTRRTVVVVAGTGMWFAKWRRGAARNAAAEWNWLHVLPMLGLATPRPVAWLARGRDSLLVTEGLPGRAFDAWWADADRAGQSDVVERHAARVVAPAVRRLHEAGLVYRDLYWNHVFCVDPAALGAPAFLDAERVFQPRWRQWRWWVKDLAGLAATAPDGVGLRARLRFLREYLGDRPSAHRRLVAAIAAKAARIRRHVPRYG